MSKTETVARSSSAVPDRDLIADPRDSPGLLLRRAAMLRALLPALAPKPPSEGNTASVSPSSTALMLVSAAANLTSSTQDAALNDSSSTTNLRRRPREEDSGAIISVQPELLREQTRAQHVDGQEGVACSTPKQQPTWKMSKVLTGHRGWVRCAAVDPTNAWFATGANDSVIKVWDLGTGAPKINLIGHKEAVRGIAISSLCPYLFSGSDDHAVKCWDLERNEIIRDFHGHHSAVHAVSCHPAMERIFVTGSRDKTVRVWDVRTRASVHTLTGHTSAVLSLTCQANDPQVISGGDDSMIYLWDLAAGKALTRLTRHRKPVRALAAHHAEFALLSCGADNIRKWKLPTGEFITNMNLATAPRANASAVGVPPIWTCCAISKRNTIFVGSDAGELLFMDWDSHSLFQSAKTKRLPGSLESECGVLCGVFDASGTRLITGEADKTVKIWNRKEE